MSLASRGTALLVAATVVVVGAVVAGIVVLGSPSAQRQQRFDSVRVQDLGAIERFVTSFARIHKRLPDSFDTLTKEPGYLVPRGDPDSGAPYEYETLGRDTYRLCATFGTVSSPEASESTWAHGIGRQCFDRHAEVSGDSVPQAVR
jgi:hypothetical protein